MFEEYQRILADRGLIDCIDGIVQLRRVLQSSEYEEDVTKVLRNHFRYIVVDEFQDVNQDQLDIVLSLLGKNGAAVVVGDPNQSIFDFRGALGADAFKYIGQYLRHNNKPHQWFSLRKNFRSLKSIVDMSNEFVDGNSKMVPAATHNNLPHGLGRKGQVCVRRYGIDKKTGRLLNEHKIVAQSIKNRHTTNTNWSDTLVLSHTHMSIKKLTDELDKLNIRWQDYSLSGFVADTTAVVVSTIHSAKGAEASNVYVIGCQALTINLTSEIKENQRRLMYVAFTRAKHRLELSCTIDATQNFHPSPEFEKIETFENESDEESEEELEFDESNDLSNLKHGQRFNVLWDDGIIYPVVVQKVEAHYVTFRWVDSQSSETTRVKKRYFTRMVRRATVLEQ